jgi:hypothetical protein
MGKADRNRARRARHAATASDSTKAAGHPALSDPKLEEEVRLFWLAIRHSCGHALDYGMDTGRYPDFADRLSIFVTAASAHPCVRCGSGTGLPHDRPICDEPTYLVAHDLWYRVCSDDQQAEATRNAKLAAVRRSDQ